MIEKLNELVRRFATLSSTRTELTTFPSGAVMLDVWRAGRLFVLQYFPSHHCFGVDEATEDNSFLTSCQFVSEELEPAAQRLWQLVQEAGRTTMEETKECANGVTTKPVRIALP